MGNRLRILPAVAAVTLSAAAILSSCKEEKKYYVRNVGDGETTPTMLTTNVSTLISDSGYTKYKIVSPTWEMYDDAKVPKWKFPFGLELEQYDTKMRVAATLRCDSATYLSQHRIWQLDVRVVMVNTLRDSFLTNQVFWDQGERKVYSDSFVHIVRSDRIIEGYGFNANEQMTEYVVNRPTGIFPLQQDKEHTASNTVDSTKEADVSRRKPARPPL